MLARLWHGRVPSVKADVYEAYLNRTGVPDYVATPGNRGAWVLRRTDGDATHFLIVTLWESEAAIEAFAGVPIDRARYYPEDDDFLLEREPTSRTTSWPAARHSQRDCQRRNNSPGTTSYALAFHIMENHI